jgi:hypothetical protein
MSKRGNNAQRTPEEIAAAQAKAAAKAAAAAEKEAEAKSDLEIVSELIQEGKPVIFFCKDQRRTISSGAVGRIEFQDGKCEVTDISTARAILNNNRFGSDIFLGK